MKAGQLLVGPWWDLFWWDLGRLSDPAWCMRGIFSLGSGKRDYQLVYERGNVSGLKRNP